MEFEGLCVGSDIRAGDHLVSPLVPFGDAVDVDVDVVSLLAQSPANQLVWFHSKIVNAIRATMFAIHFGIQPIADNNEATDFVRSLTALSVILEYGSVPRDVINACQARHLKVSVTGT